MGWANNDKSVDRLAPSGPVTYFCGRRIRRPSGLGELWMQKGSPKMPHRYWQAEFVCRDLHVPVATSLDDFR